VTALLYFGQLLEFGSCLALGFTVRSADVHCAIQAINVPIGALAPTEQSAVVPCDADEMSAQAVVNCTPQSVQ